MTSEKKEGNWRGDTPGVDPMKLTAEFLYSGERKRVECTVYEVHYDYCRLAPTGV
jgi:hypothetical protein